jgi:hypothetical protein
MRLGRASLAAVALMLAGAGAPAHAESSSWEPGTVITTTRAIRVFSTPGAAQCRDACLANGRCAAWNFVPSGARGRRARHRCEFYSRVEGKRPARGRSAALTIAGVKQARPDTATPAEPGATTIPRDPSPAAKPRENAEKPSEEKSPAAKPSEAKPSEKEPPAAKQGEKAPAPAKPSEKETASADSPGRRPDPPPATSPRRSSWEPGLSLLGQGFAYEESGAGARAGYRLPEVQACRDLCLKHAPCRGWTFNTADYPHPQLRNLCFLFSNTPSRIGSNISGVISGLVDEPR